MVNRGLITRGGVLEDVLGLEDTFSSPWPWPQVLENCPVLGSRTALFFEWLKFCRSAEKCFSRPFFLEIDGKKFFKTFFLWKTLAFVSLVLGLEHFCPWSRPRIFFVSLALASSLVSLTPPLLITFGTHFERSETIWRNLIAEIWQHLYFWVEFFKWFG